MSSLCVLTCGGSVTDPPVRFDDPCVTTTRRSGFAYFNLLRCDLTLDLTDGVAVSAALAAGEIACSPFGAITLNAPSSDDVDLGCDRIIKGESTYLIDYESYLTGANDDECTYYTNLKDSAHIYRWLGIDCEGMVFYDDGANPGFPFSLTTLPHWVAGDGGLGKWVAQFSITTNTLICPRTVAGLDSVLCSQ